MNGMFKLTVNRLKKVESEEESTSAVEDEPKSKGDPFTECNDEESDSDLDLDELAQALETATILASHFKKQNARKHTNKVAKSPVATRMIDDSATPVLPCFYMYSEKDSSKGKIAGSIPDDCSISLKEIEKSSANENDEEEGWEGENYEYDKALGADRTYLKLKKQLDAKPEQCFRYCYGGNPLLPVANLPKPEKCTICGEGRRFELQLMPPLLYFVQEATDGSSDISVDEWAWLTIIIFTCPKSCYSGEEADSSCWFIAKEEAIIIHDD